MNITQKFHNGDRVTFRYNGLSKSIIAGQVIEASSRKVVVEEDGTMGRWTFRRANASAPWAGRSFYGETSELYLKA